MNVEAIEAGVRHAEDEPRRFNMKVGISKHDISFARRFVSRMGFSDTPPCGTTCCLAGAICIAAGVQFGDPDTYMNQISWSAVKDMAMKIAGIDDATERRLFHVQNWPAEFYIAYVNAQNARERVAVLRSYWDEIKAVQRILNS